MASNLIKAEEWITPKQIESTWNITEDDCGSESSQDPDADFNDGGYHLQVARDVLQDLLQMCTKLGSKEDKLMFLKFSSSSDGCESLESVPLHRRGARPHPRTQIRDNRNR
jgi:hypothetical protein